MGFGEYCRYKCRSQESLSNTGGSRFRSGVFLGIDQRTGQYMIYGDDVVHLARTVTRVPESEKWQKDALANVKLTPYNMHVPTEPEVVFREKPNEGNDVPVDRMQLARQLYLKPDDFLGEQGCGLTRGCPKCDYFLRHQQWGTKPHSKTCRDRVTNEIAKTAAGKRRIAAATSRLDSTIADLGQQYREDVPQGELNGDVVADLPATTDDPPAFLPIPTSEEMIDESRPVRPDVRPDRPDLRHDVAADTHIERPRDALDEFLASPLRPEDADDGPGMSSMPIDGGMDIDIIEDKPDTDLQEILAMMRANDRDEIKDANDEILAVIRSLGGDRGKYKRERSKAMRAMVSEFYSPPRVTAATKLLPELRLIPGFALDLTTSDVDGRAWDFDEKEMRDRAMAKVRDEKPMLLIGSPMCTAFSTWQRINAKIRDPLVVEAERRRAVEHLQFSVELYREQMRNSLGTFSMSTLLMRLPGKKSA